MPPPNLCPPDFRFWKRFRSSINAAEDIRQAQISYKVTDNISVPVPSGQGQHGTAWFMSDKIKRRAFDYISISKADPLISRLVSIGEERYRAIENGEIFNPPKADQTLTDSAGIVLAREMSRGTERLPCITDDYHTLTIGATRCGKSRCLVLQSICALALAGEGIVANDPKGSQNSRLQTWVRSLSRRCFSFCPTRKPPTTPLSPCWFHSSTNCL